jgi:hypothetical protein
MKVKLLLLFLIIILLLGCASIGTERRLQSDSNCEKVEVKKSKIDFAKIYLQVVMFPAEMLVWGVYSIPK